MSITRRFHLAARAAALFAVAMLAQVIALPALAADTLNVYSIWPENWAKPMFEEFEKATGIKVNFVRFSSGEALARLIAEKNNPRVDVLFGGPVETFAAGIGEGIFESYKPPSFNVLPARFRQADWSVIAIADDRWCSRPTTSSSRRTTSRRRYR
jgi:iron(III) transport system substrate-binding protein